MHLSDEDVFVPFLVFAIPVVAIAGGILASVIRTISAHRLMEAAVRERMALIARGVDPARIPSGAAAGGHGARIGDFAAATRFRAQGLLIAGFVTLAAGGSVALVGGLLDSWETNDWGLGIVAASVGLALIAGGLIIWPRGHGAQPASPTHAIPPRVG